MSPQFQRREAEQRAQDRGDHKARNDLGLAPSNQLEMVVKRRHPEDTPAGQLERPDLNDDREGFHDEDTSDDAEQQLLLDENGNRTKRRSESKRSDVAHEDLGGG